jgi:hypothetical protein
MTRTSHALLKTSLAIRSVFSGQTDTSRYPLSWKEFGEAIQAAGKGKIEQNGSDLFGSMWDGERAIFLYGDWVAMAAKPFWEKHLRYERYLPEIEVKVENKPATSLLREIGKGRNIAIVDYDVDGETGPQYATSGQHAYPGANPGSRGNPTFVATATGANSRVTDSEYRLLNWVGENFDTDASRTVNMYTERAPCSSCRSVIGQFRAWYTHINLTVRWGPGFFA